MNFSDALTQSLFNIFRIQRCRNRAIASDFMLLFYNMYYFLLVDLVYKLGILDFVYISSG